MKAANFVPQSTCRLRLVQAHSIDEIDSAEWDKINAPNGIYWTHRFIKSVEHSGSENAVYWYLLVYKEEELIATAVLTSFIVTLDMLVSKPIQKFCNLIRRVWPSFFRIRVLFCGIPVSIGKHTLTIADKTLAQEVVTAITQHMDQIARAERIKFLCFKEFAEPAVELCNYLETSGYFKANSLPRMVLKIRWRTFTSYLDEMRHNYRRQIKQSLSKLGLTGADSILHEVLPVTIDSPRLIVTPASSALTDKIHALYLQVLQRTNVKLEVLPRRFFEQLFSNMDKELVLLSLTDLKSVLGVVILGHNASELTFLFAGLNYGLRNQYDCYLNLLSGIVAYAISRGFKSVDLGQTSYWSKQRMGGEATPVYFFFRARNPVVHSLLRNLREVLFPPSTLLSPRVFRRQIS